MKYLMTYWDIEGLTKREFETREDTQKFLQTLIARDQFGRCIELYEIKNEIVDFTDFLPLKDEEAK